MMRNTRNYRKYNSKSFLQQVLLWRFQATIISMLNEFNIRSVIDVGCGEGFILKHLSQHGVGSSYEGIDISKTAINIAKEIFPRATFRIGSANNISGVRSSYDLVVCTEVLEHLLDPEGALLQIKKVSKKYVLISVPNEPFFMLANFIRGKNIARMGNDPEHINHWTSFGIERLVKKNGFEIVDIRHPFPWTVILAIINTKK
jgi:2-polyprenyl-3-methyl-5-hydroxy-6-metoxy-1,4-benzoquinol methylase